MKRIALLILAVMASSSCVKNAITGKRSLELIPESEMISMSLTEYKTFLTQNPPLSANDEQVLLVKRTGTRIQKAVEKFYADNNLKKELEGFNWEFNVVNSNEINAWCMPGGKVVVYTGLLPVTQTEEALAIVMGHEIGHAVARHGNQRMSEGMLVQFGGTALSLATSQKPAFTRQLFQQAYGVTTQLGTLKYSRTQESEADKMGLVFAAMAGYDPEVAIPFWQRMSASNTGQKPSELLSTHPSDATRIKDLQAFMPQAKKYYKPQ